MTSVRQSARTATNDVPIIPGYRLLQCVGEGAFGMVWRAEEALTGLPRAVKILSKSMSPPQFDPERELEGIRAYQRLAADHAHLLQIHHVGETDECFFYVMELADCFGAPRTSVREELIGAGLSPAQSEQNRDREGAVPVPPPLGRGQGEGDPAEKVSRSRELIASDSRIAPNPFSDPAYQPFTLSALIDYDAPLDPARALDITRQVLLGLAHLHANGLLHRDVKPSNVLFVNGAVKLADVGLVTSMDHTLTVVGTPGYVPPDGAMDPSADLYAAGVMLYEMLTGLHRTRFPELPRELLSRARSRAERRTLRHAVAVMNKAGNWERRKRFASATQFLQDATTLRFRWRAPRFSRWLAVIALAAMILAWFGSRQVDLQGGTLLQDSRMIEADSSWVFSWKRSDYGSKLCAPVAIDLDGDGIRELIVAGREGSNSRRPEDSGLIFAHSTHWGWPKLCDFWNAPLRTYSDPPWSSDLPRPWCATSLSKHHFDLDGIPGDEFLATVVYPDGACQILIINGRQIVLGSFWHFGQVDVQAIADSQSGENKELFCVGWCREYDPNTQRHSAHYCMFILNVGPRGALSGQWCSWEAPPTSTENLQAYGIFKKYALLGDNDPAHTEGIQWGPKSAAFKSPLPGSNTVEVELENGRILMLDRRLRPIGQGIRLLDRVVDVDEPEPVGDVWQPLWPPNP